MMENHEFQELVLAQLNELTEQLGQISKDISYIKDGQKKLEQGQHRMVEDELANVELELNSKTDRVYTLSELLKDINLSRIKQGNPMEIQVKRYYQYKSFADSQVQLLVKKLAEILDEIKVTVTYEMNDITTRRKSDYRDSGVLTEMEGDLQQVSVHFGTQGSYLSLRKVEKYLSYHLMLHSGGLVLANLVYDILENVIGFQQVPEDEVFI